MRTRLLLLTVGLALATFAASRAQSPAPVILQAAAPAAPTAAAAATPAPAARSGPTMLETLQQMQATNVETIHKQEAALQTLDALQTAAEEIKIFSKRG